MKKKSKKTFLGESSKKLLNKYNFPSEAKYGRLDILYIVNAEIKQARFLARKEIFDKFDQCTCSKNSINIKDDEWYLREKNKLLGDKE